MYKYFWDLLSLVAVNSESLFVVQYVVDIFISKFYIIVVQT